MHWAFATNALSLSAYNKNITMSTVGTQKLPNKHLPNKIRLVDSKTLTHERARKEEIVGSIAAIYLFFHGW